MKTEIKVITRNFQKGKQELIWGMGKREGSIAIAWIENDLIQSLLEHNRQRGREVLWESVHKEKDTEALINECRGYRCRKQKKRAFNKERK